MATLTEDPNEGITAQSEVSPSEYAIPGLALQEYEFSPFRACPPLTSVRDWQKAQPKKMVNRFKITPPHLLH
jgi:hypothetical protein